MSDERFFNREYSGQVKWFRSCGYGFITVLIAPAEMQSMIGRDIFVHHTDITPKTSTYKTLAKGEYVSFNLVKGSRDIQATNVRGVFGGTLLCDCMNMNYFNRGNDTSREPVVLLNGDISFQPGEDVFL